MMERVAVATDVLSRAKRLVDPAWWPSCRRCTPTCAEPPNTTSGTWRRTGRRPPEPERVSVRPSRLLSAEAVGAPAEVGIPAAVAIELMHDFSLLHDDIIDGDQQRRHRPTVWALFEIGQAILVGDELQTLAHQVLLDQRTEAGIAAGHRLATAVAEMIAGQADDMALERGARRRRGVRGWRPRRARCCHVLRPSAPSSLAARREQWMPSSTSAPTSDCRSRPSTTCLGSGEIPRSRANPWART